MSSCCVAIVGVGLVGKQVVQQLTSPALSGLFKIVSLTNSKHTLALSPSAPSLDAKTLLSLLPASSQPLPTESSHPAASYSPASPTELVKKLAADARASKQHTILIDCTSDLAVTELYPAAISSGLSVVTPNKKGFSSSSALFQQVVDAQSAPNAGLVYLEATVGAGLPIISTLRDLLKTGDEVTKIEGVFSGTMSYIFNNFSPATPAEGPAPKFSEVVKVAKENGYTVRPSPFLLSFLSSRSCKADSEPHPPAGAAPGRRPVGLGRRPQAHDPVAPPVDQPLVARGAPLAPRGLRLARHRDAHPLGARRLQDGRRVCAPPAGPRRRV